MIELSIEQMEMVSGGSDGGKLALFVCGIGVGAMILQPWSVFAIGQTTAIACSIGIASQL